MPITSNTENVTVVGTAEVNLDNANDDVLVYGSDGAANRALKTDSNGQLYTIVSGVSSTEYTVDAAAPAAPVGGTIVAERDDQLATLTEAEADWTNLRASSKGALWVTIPDTNGDPITAFGGGTQYTEDAAAAADPVGTAPILVRKDTPATVTSTDGDNIAQRGTNYGAAYCQILTSAGAYVDSFGGGTEYTEDAAAAANPVGGATILVRTDTPATQVSTDGDNIAQRGTNYGAAYCQIVTSAGAYVDTFGGGTQYTEADTDASITGTAMMWEDTSDTLRAVSAAKPLPIGDAGGSLTVDGTVGTKTALTASSPTLATVGTTSAQAVASNGSRKGLILVNTSNVNISLGIGASAVLNSGITLIPGASFVMDEYSFATGAVNAIAAAASSNLAIQEFT